ncbi:hypothetical protein JTE90_019317 [Oedothorax gibbosus]|uniref:Uncharacterized protein n=1 Tax=Oedothorax gibbosus TaxID=931172 RepID=A0AAV6TKR9_9ARAC|nr:hypothetical protein JTE90_019317 [Oedothorax gibbosus]
MGEAGRCAMEFPGSDMVKAGRCAMEFPVSDMGSEMDEAGRCALEFPGSDMGPIRRYLHLVVVGGLACSSNPESYAGGSLATGRVSHAGQVFVG